MTEVREYYPVAGGGLPRFHAGSWYTINGRLCEVVRVQGVMTNPERVVVEVDPCPREELSEVCRFSGGP